MYWYLAMWRAFQYADASRDGDTASRRRPRFARWALTSATVSLARSCLGVPQSAPAVQSPVSAAARACRVPTVAPPAASAVRAKAARTAAALRLSGLMRRGEGPSSRPLRRSILADG